MRNVLIFTAFVATTLSYAARGFVVQPAVLVSPRHTPSTPKDTSLRSEAISSLDSICTKLEDSLKQNPDVCKTQKVRVGPTSTHRLGLIATQSISKGEVVLGIPYDDRFVLSASYAEKVLKLPKDFDSWTGQTGLIALLLLQELALAAGAVESLDKNRPADLQEFVGSWIRSLPFPKVDEMFEHPYLWSEMDQELLQASSTTKLYRLLDDVEDDVAWFTENIWQKNPAQYPATVALDADTTVPCYSLQGFQWAMAMVQSRSFFLDGTLRLIPVLDMCNHANSANEIRSGQMGRFGLVTGAELVASQDYEKGDEIFCSYGPKSAADYLLEHGFLPPTTSTTPAVAALTFELDANDRFREDKLDILEFETYDLAPMDPVQTFDLVSGPSNNSGEPDPALLQFLRLVMLGATDAFLLESIFRKEVWGFMAYPVSELNELAVMNAIADSCQRALDDFDECPEEDYKESPVVGPLCLSLKAAETKALKRTIEFVQRETEALDLKEYYQERRLKDLGLDSEWSPEDDAGGGGDDLMFGQTRAPGGADYDW